MQALDLIDPIPHIVQLLVETFFFDDFSRCMQQKFRIRGHIVVDLHSIS